MGVLTEYDEKATMEAIAKESFREGYREGLQKALREEFLDPEKYLEVLCNVFVGLVRQEYTIREAMEMTGITKEQAKKALDQRKTEQESGN